MTDVTPEPIANPHLAEARAADKRQAATVIEAAGKKALRSDDVRRIVAALREEAEEEWPGEVSISRVYVRPTTNDIRGRISVRITEQLAGGSRFVCIPLTDVRELARVLKRFAADLDDYTDEEPRPPALPRREA